MTPEQRKVALWDHATAAAKRMSEPVALQRYNIENWVRLDLARERASGAAFEAEVARRVQKKIADYEAMGARVV